MEFDEESGLQYFGARYYDSWSGTWMTQDVYRGQINDPASLHRYQFVENNPVNAVDKDGYLLEELAGYGAKIYEASVLKEPVNLYNVKDASSLQETPGGTISGQWSGNITLDFSKSKTALTGTFDATQQFTPTSGKNTVQFGRGEGGMEVFGGPAIGGQITGATVQRNKVTQLVNKRYTSGGGQKFLTPSAKFALDEQKALVEAKQRAYELKVKERKQRLALVEQLDRVQIKIGGGVEDLKSMKPTKAVLVTTGGTFAERFWENVKRYPKVVGEIAKETTKKTIEETSNFIEAVDWWQTLRGTSKFLEGGALAVGGIAACVGGIPACTAGGLVTAPGGGIVLVPSCVAAAAAVCGTGVYYGSQMMSSGLSDIGGSYEPEPKARGRGGEMNIKSKTFSNLGKGYESIRIKLSQRGPHFQLRPNKGPEIY